MSFEIAAWSVKKSLLDFIYTVVEAYLSFPPGGMLGITNNGLLDGFFMLLFCLKLSHGFHKHAETHN